MYIKLIKKTDQINELKTKLEIANKKNTDFQLQQDNLNELNQNKINEIDKKQQGI